MFFIMTEPGVDLSTVVRELGGRILNSCWVVPWNGTADALAIKLRRAIRARVVVCRMDDWSYR
jgi:hypothetical protein